MFRSPALCTSWRSCQVCSYCEQHIPDCFRLIDWLRWRRATASIIKPACRLIFKKCTMQPLLIRYLLRNSLQSIQCTQCRLCVFMCSARCFSSNLYFTLHTKIVSGDNSVPSMSWSFKYFAVIFWLTEIRIILHPIAKQSRTFVKWPTAVYATSTGSWI